MTHRSILVAPRAAIALLGLLAAACSTPSLESQVFTLQSGYTAAMVPAASYVEQPRCGTLGAMPAPLCSDPVIVERIKDAVDIAGPAVRGAQAEVRRESGNRTTVRAFLDTARAAVAALIAATPQKGPSS